MSEVVTIENANLAYEAIEHESPQARYASRLKFACCRQCGTDYGMQPVYWKTLEEMSEASIKLHSWHELPDRPDRDEYLFYPCRFCNPDGNIPDGFVPLAVDEVLIWFTDPMQQGGDSE